MSSVFDQTPEWRGSPGIGAVAHLMNRNAVGMRTWCGYTADQSREIEIPAKKCANCMRKFREFVTSVEAAPPEMVTTDYTIRVVRPTQDEIDNNFQDLLKRKFAGNRRMKISFLEDVKLDG